MEFDGALYDKAYQLATERHGNQKYGENHPYTVHLCEVASQVKTFFPTSKFHLQIAALLHDILEDTQTTFDELYKGFGKEIAEVVFAVTNESGENRKARHLKTYPKIKANPDAILLKLADRLANTRASIGMPIMSMYTKEYKGFREALYEPGTEADPMWEALDQLMK